MAEQPDRSIGRCEHIDCLSEREACCPTRRPDPPEALDVLGGAEPEKYGRIHQEQNPKSRASREDFTLV